jgi:hypothetical protein
MPPKSPSRKTWIFSFVPQAQHHLTEGQHHFERSENIIPPFLGTNERGCGKPQMMGCFASMMWARANDVALRANGELQFRPMSPKNSVRVSVRNFYLLPLHFSLKFAFRIFEVIGKR